MVSSERLEYWLAMLVKVPKAQTIMEDLGVEEAGDLLEVLQMLYARELTHIVFGADKRGDQGSCRLPEKGVFLQTATIVSIHMSGATAQTREGILDFRRRCIHVLGHIMLCISFAQNQSLPRSLL